MDQIRVLNMLASRLSIADISQLTDEEITAMAMERPEHPGQFGFLLNPQYFSGTAHLSETTVALMQRLLAVKKKLSGLKKSSKSY